MVRGSLTAMCTGGLYDQLCGGFFRCSSDVCWQIPQFDKHVAHNALLATLYCEAYQAMGVEMFIQVAKETLDFILHSLSGPDGSFMSSISATTSEASEGTHYLWKHDELIRRLSPQEFEAFADTFGVTEWGNFEDGSNHLRLEQTEGCKGEDTWHSRYDDAVQAAMGKLRAAREKRELPPADDKVVAAWNGLVITAFAKAYRVFLASDEDSAGQYLKAAQTAASKIKANLWRDGKLYRVGHADSTLESDSPG